MAVNILTISHGLTMLELAQIKDSRALQDHIDRTAVLRMADALLPLVKIEDMSFDDELCVQRRVYSIAVGDASTQTEIAEAVEKRAQEIADERFAAMSAAAVKNIENWGSYYGVATISKSDAIRLVAEAFAKPK